MLARDGKRIIWVYEKGKPVRRSTPDREARERDLYAFDEDGGKNVQAEEWLSRIEQNVAPIMKRLQEKGYVLTSGEKEWVALFVGTMHTRTPAGLELLDTRVAPAASRVIKEVAQDPDEFRSLCCEAFREANVEVDLEALRKDVLKGRGDVLSQRPDLRLASALEIGRRAAGILTALDWQVIYADGAELFLTSDRPVVTGLWEEDGQSARFGAGFEVPGVEIGFPLSRSTYLRMRKGIEPGPRRLPDSGVRNMNKVTMLCARRRAYAAERSTRLTALFNERGCEVTVEGFQPVWKGKTIL